MATPSPIPKLSELQELVRSTVAAASFFATKRITVVADTGTSDKTVEAKLRSKGFAVVVPPVIEAKPRDQSGPAWIVDATVLVRLIANPEVNDRSEEGSAGAQVNLYDAIVAVIDAVRGMTRHPGGERFRLHAEGIKLSRFDEGLWSYDIYFAKDVML